MRGLVSPDCVFVRTLTYTLSICVDGVKGRTSSRVAYSTRISLAGRKHRAPSFGRPGSMLLCWSWRAPSSQSVPTSPCQRDGASRCRLDAAAIAGGDNRGCQAQASDSRSRPDFGEASGRFDPGARARGVAVTRSKSESQCNLRAGVRTIRRECLDWSIPISEAHLRALLERMGIPHITTVAALTVRWDRACRIRCNQPPRSRSPNPAISWRRVPRSRESGARWPASRVFPCNDNDSYVRVEARRLTPSSDVARRP